MKLLLIKILFIQSLILAQSQDPFEINQYMLAENYEQSGNLQKALEIIENLFQKNPDNPNYFIKLYNLYINTKKYETAIRFLELRIKSYPEDPSLYGMLGAIYYLMGDFKNAKFYWDSPIKKNPSNPFIYRIIANYAIERRAFEIAIDYLETAKKISNDPTIFAV
ncbi:MAG: tetratricopeptide repeat protein, partial [Ignavibacterium sp.]|nr:tetratricopeptide repeat protein [Ignavibacterium sp.]